MKSEPGIPVIDVHAHFGAHELGEANRIDRWHSGDAELVSLRAARAGIDWTVVSALTALLPFRGNILKGNTEAEKAVSDCDNLLFWTVMDPTRPESLAEAEALLAHPKCMGIKVHPFLHHYDSRESVGPIFEIAERHQAVILAHSGDKGSYPEDFLPWADRFSRVSLIVAHLGHGDDNLRSRQVRAVAEARNRNIWTDTSSSFSIASGVIEWAVQEVGDDRILFGTDAPLYSAACQKARIESAEISEESKTRILGGNAQHLFERKLGLLKENS